MGKWSTYRHRGAVRQAAAAPTVPPAPTLLFNPPDAVATPTGETDTDGFLNLYYSDQETGPWTKLFTIPWAEVGIFNDVGSGYWYATETGNGSTYAGESPPSNILET